MAAFLLVLTFDADTTNHQPDYEQANVALSQLGLARSLRDGGGTMRDLPLNTYAGSLSGESAAAVATDVRDRAAGALANCSIVGSLFVVAGGNWAWRTNAPNA